MKSAVINRQYLMGAIMNAQPTIGSVVHSKVPHTETLSIGTLIELFSCDLNRVTDIDTSTAKAYLNSNVENVGVWLNNFCQFVLPYLLNLYKSK